MNEISKDKYLEHVVRNLVPNSREEGYFESDNYKCLGVIVKDLTDNDYQAITHKRVNIDEYEFDNSEHDLRSFDEAYKALERLMSGSD